VELRGESAAENAARLSAQAAAQQQVAAEVHTKIIKTKHVLAEDYWSLREDELDDEVHCKSWACETI
jgi:TfoX/Sxy family transcriptional regulator of competence genes